MPLIEVDNLAKTFKTRERAAGLAGSLHSFVAPRYREREAVKRISFTLEPGELLAFIGPNGAGKSTTIKMLTGILRVDTVTFPTGEMQTINRLALTQAPQMIVKEKRVSTTVYEQQRKTR
jgi:ABC-type uncharacterized transport system ATPase subunit